MAQTFQSVADMLDGIGQTKTARILRVISRLPVKTLEAIGGWYVAIDDDQRIVAQHVEKRLIKEELRSEGRRPKDYLIFQLPYYEEVFPASATQATEEVQL